MSESKHTPMSTTVHEESASPLAQLRALISAGEFHHATYLKQRTLWEGLWFYRRSQSGFYEVAGCIPAGSPELDDAYRAISATGTHVGSYGNG